MIVRLVEPGDDLDAVGRLILAAYLALPDGPREPDYERELLDVRARSALVPVAVAIEEGCVLGSVTYVPSATSPHAEFTDPDAAGFRMLAVDPEAQERGVGRALVQWTLDRARAEGRARVIIHSGVWMKAAHHLYGAMGFERRPELDWVPVPDVQLLGFVHELS